jgi:transketolase
MRKEACKSWCSLFSRKPFAFLTGDLGYGALEPLRDEMGPMFINAGVAEQNMVSVAAGMAKCGLSVWVYSIAPFCYARPFEQIRNDVCMNRLPVKLVGNGGGFGYGPMGATHHALEDYGALLTLPGMHIYVPAFAGDVEPVIERMTEETSPSYLRLGACEKPQDFSLQPYQPWRRLLPGHTGVLLAVGPLAGGLVNALCSLAESKRPELWVLTEFPLEKNLIPVEFTERVQAEGRLAIVEEHVAHGGLGQMMAYTLLKRGITLKHFDHFCAQGYRSGTYGSQKFHRKENAIDAQSVIFRWVEQNP